jgi:hypothetical protein
MLPYLQHLQDSDEAFRPKTPMSPYADCTWSLSTRLLGRSITPENSMHLPVCLSQECLTEEIPCFTYNDGFTFVLTFKDNMFSVTPVKVTSESPDYYEDITFTDLPLHTDVVQFTPNAMTFTMRQGLRMRTGKAFLDEPPNDDTPPIPTDSRVLPFVMCPIIRHDAVLLLNKHDGAIKSFGQQADIKREELTIGVVRRNASSGTYLRYGHYCLHSFDTDESCVVQEDVDFTFVHRCMLMDGHVIYWTMTPADYDDLLKDIYVSRKNDHIRDRAFTLDHNRSTDCMYLQCFYTISHQAPSDLEHAKMQAMFIIKDKYAFSDNDTDAFNDVPIFDSNFNMNVHVMSPEDDSLIVRNFVFE